MTCVAKGEYLLSSDLTLAPAAASTLLTTSGRLIFCHTDDGPIDSRNATDSDVQAPIHSAHARNDATRRFDPIKIVQDHVPAHADIVPRFLDIHFHFSTDHGDHLHAIGQL